MGGHFKNLGGFQELDGNNRNPFIPHLPNPKKKTNARIEFEKM